MKQCVSTTREVPSEIDDYTTHKEGGRKHHHTNKKKRLPGNQPGGPSKIANLEGSSLACPVCAEAFRAASFFKLFSDAFRFCDNPVFSIQVIADFIAGALRCRAKNLTTLKRVTDFANQYYKFATEREHPFPIAGAESLLSITLRLKELAPRGTSIPNMGRYSLKVFGESLGVVFPIDHPAVKVAVSIPRGRNVKTAPAVETEFLKALENHAANRQFPGGQRLYAALFALLGLSSLRFGDTKQVSDLFNSGTALCGIGVNTKDRSGDIMSWATPLMGLSWTENWFKPILDFWEKINFSTSKHTLASSRPYSPM